MRIHLGEMLCLEEVNRLNRADVFGSMVLADIQCIIQDTQEERERRDVLFNDALDTFYCDHTGVGHTYDKGPNRCK